MIDVYVSGPAEDVAQLEVLGNKIQGRFRFSGEPKPGAARVQLLRAVRGGLLSVTRAGGVLVSLDQSEGISLYAGIPRSLYMLICVVLGLVYWRVLELNPLLIWEDLFVREDPECLCAARGTVQEYALAFERPWICPACLEFLRCTGAEPETAALQDVLAHATSAQDRTPAKVRL
ncbi:MAG: hypothetical protein NTZ09_07120 [Candidatus Hydrogenedentes bacterium]|nr:hypothetical protein [Candidatus Hydrogenedentota bacterium]